MLNLTYLFAVDVVRFARSIAYSCMRGIFSQKEHGWNMNANFLQMSNICWLSD